MKKLFSLCLTAIFVFTFSLVCYAEIIVDDEWFYDEMKDIFSDNTTSGTTNSSPNFSNTTNASMTFYISDTGKAIISYSVALKADANESATVEIYLDRHIFGPFWERIDPEWSIKSTEKYLTDTVTTTVDKSAKYRVTMKVSVGKDKFTIKSEYNYPKDTLTGDVNDDGKITASDARLALRFSAGLDTYTSAQQAKCDMNSDGVITAADARLILKLSASLE
ncbi:MAG: dockerin type I repeat-containing protein [Clostridia bacterium]|nr:dockerin type I repeat-containing protein [Clostridia bacterium]